ncbi:hypothetical protein QEN19_001486 [Hanseniaspora menglaensis]
MVINAEFTSSSSYCGSCHLLIRDVNFDSSLLSLSKLQIDSITNNKLRTIAETPKTLLHKDHQASSILNQRLSTKKLQNLKVQPISNGSSKLNKDLKTSSYVLLDGTSLNQNPVGSVILSSNSNNNSDVFVEDQTLSRKIWALEPIFQILNESLDSSENEDGHLVSSIKHPLCKECCDILTSKLNEEYMDLLAEKEKYQDFLKKLDFHKQRVANVDNTSIILKTNNNTAESIKSMAYKMSPKKKRLSINSPMTSPTKFDMNISPKKKDLSLTYQQDLSILTENDLENLKEIQKIEKETQELVDKLEKLNAESDLLEITLKKEKLMLSKMKKEYMSKMNGINNVQMIEYSKNLQDWSTLSSNTERVHEDLANLRNLNVYNTIFNISSTDVSSSVTSQSQENEKYNKNLNNFGTINGLRMGYNWRETNAALGQVVLCLCNLSIPIKSSQHTADLTNTNIEWYPSGSVSKIVKQGVEYDCFYDPLDVSITRSIVGNSDLATANSENSNNWNFLFFKNGTQEARNKKEFKISRLRLFNESMVLILSHINTLIIYFNKIKADYNGTEDKPSEWTLPYGIKDEKINNVSIKYLGKNGNNTVISTEWVLASKFMLVNLRYLMVYRHKLFLMEQQQND